MVPERVSHSCIAIFAVAVLAFAGDVDPVRAKTGRDAKGDDFAHARPTGTPMLAIVSLGEQRVTIYDAGGKILQSPVSSGATSYETPAGIFSVVQKQEEHYSNLYEDGQMPFMQRITWTGIALHGGVLPGHPASHGCIRLPLPFAKRLFELTNLGMRVIVVRDDMAPAEIAHPGLFQPSSVAQPATPVIDRPSGSNQSRPLRRITASRGDVPSAPDSPRHLETLKSLAVAKSAHAEAVARRAKQARSVAAKRTAEATPAVQAVRTAETNHAKAELALKNAERLLETAASPVASSKAEQDKAKAAAKLAGTQAQLEAAKVRAQAKKDAAQIADDEAQAAETEKDAAEQEAREAARKTSPVSVFISRKMQRVYVRRANEPVFEGPVTIREPDKSIGTYVFTALKYVDGGAQVRWSVVGMYKNAANAEPIPPGQHRRADARNSEAAGTDVAAAKAALDRISIPQDVIDQISDVLPGSSLIVSDEGASIETGKDTDFVVLMSGEPQGALKARSREPIAQYGNDGAYRYRRSPYGGFPGFWN